MSTSRDFTGFGRTFVEQVRERDVTYNAASIAYYAFVSLIPLLLLALVIASAVGMTDQIVNWRGMRCRAARAHSSTACSRGPRARLARPWSGS